MSVKVMAWVWEHSRSKKTERLVLLAIADCASEDGSNAYPSTAELMRKTGLSERGVQGAIGSLVALGELFVSRNGGPRGCNRYRVIMATPQDLPLQIVPPAGNAGADPAGGAGDAPAQDAPPQETTETPADPAPGTVLEPPKKISSTKRSTSGRAAKPKPEPFDENAESAQALVGGWIDFCAGRGVQLPKQLIGHYAKQIKQALDDGFAPNMIKKALAAMLTENLANRPSLLPNKLVQIQTGPEVLNGNGNCQRSSTTDQRVNAALALKNEFRDEQQRSIGQ
jgi:hypothetical protein